MSLKDLLRLSNDKLHERFTAKPYDPAKDRDKVLKAIDRMEEQHRTKGVVRGRKWFSKNEGMGITRVAPPFKVGGKSEHFVESSQFGAFCNAFRGAVRSGELDDAIAGGLQSNRGGAGKKRAGWSAERRAAYEASKKN